MKQKDALVLLKLGENVFLTGAAGSGKTFLLNQYIKYLKSKKIPVAITASTGIAATHIDGITIHSWCGMGIAKTLSETELKTIINRNYLKDRLIKTKVLIIDEISMLDADRLDLVDSICRSIKRSVLPFGGIQVILCGDFFQLPPVNGRNEQNEYAFRASSWNKSELRVCYLKEQHRHENKKFTNILNAIRTNKVDKKILSSLKDRINKPVLGNITPTKLFTKNNDVDSINNIELLKIKEKEVVYKMDSFCENGKQLLVDSLIKNCTAPEKLILKKGAVVMFVKNKFDESGRARYVNGTLGKVIGFNDIDKYPIIETYDGKEIVAYPREWAIEEGDEIMAKISQIPLRLAWAITVHKSQGMSLDEVVIDLRGAFDYGMGYVALSRVRSLEGMCLLGLNEMSLQISPEIYKKDKLFVTESKKNLDNLNKLSKKEKSKKEKDYLISMLRKDANDLFGGVFNN